MFWCLKNSERSFTNSGKYKSAGGSLALNDEDILTEPGKIAKTWERAHLAGYFSKHPRLTGSVTLWKAARKMRAARSHLPPV